MLATINSVLVAIVLASINAYQMNYKWPSCLKTPNISDNRCPILVAHRGKQSQSMVYNYWMPCSLNSHLSTYFIMPLSEDVRGIEADSHFNDVAGNQYFIDGEHFNVLLVLH